VDFERYVAELERGHRRLWAAAARHEPDNLVVLSTTPSTNLLARGVAVDFESEGLELEPLLVLALEQTAGRGRQGRSWSSPRGKGVYATLARLYQAPELLPALPLLVGVGLCRALAPHLPRGCRLKWPNDLLAPDDGAPDGRRGRKIGGVLIEALVHPGDGCVALIGFGVNHGHRRDELPEGATSLMLESGGHVGGAGVGVGLAALTWDLVAGVQRELEHAGDLPYAVAAWRELSIHRPGDRLRLRLGDRDVEGTFAGIDDAGRLRLRRPPPDGDDLLLAAGEVIEG
jgi:BirA family biotin operon repressor/biotin-[acetyl-CoA-carboxylase] ligase